MTDEMQAETIRITGHDDDELEAYLAQPLDSGPYGGVVVIHHMPGYDEPTKEITRRFAAARLPGDLPEPLQPGGHRREPGRRRGVGPGQGRRPR